jgi:biotin transport system substrate-specific component
MQTFFAIMSGMVLGPKDGPASQAVYILTGFMGLPVFSGGGGPSYILSPSLGYLAGFVLGSSVAGIFAGRGRVSFRRALAASMLGSAAVYALGVPYLAVYLSIVLHKADALGIALKTGLAVFLPGDIVKCILAAGLAPRISGISYRAGMSGGPHG